MNSNLSIVGIVKDTYNNPLPSMTISVDGEGVQQIISVFSDLEGHFELLNLPPPGQYLLSARGPSFLLWEKPVKVTPNKPLEVSITLQLG